MRAPCLSRKRERRVISIHLQQIFDFAHAGAKSRLQRVPVEFADRLSFARKLRRNQTDAERRLWSRLRNRQIHGRKFRRQFPIGPYFADFVCLEIRLVVELDGGQHDDPRHRRQDAIRSDMLVGRGFEVLRFWDNDVLHDTDAVVSEIAKKIGALTRTSCDLSRKRER